MRCGTAQKKAVAATRVVAAVGRGRGVGRGRPPLDLTEIPVASNLTVTLPSRSVRNTRAPRASTRANVAGDGWPYGLPAPADATATVASAASRKASVEAVRLPWCAILRRST